ncbi:hypothetical protein AgCh_000370 [Apium graveolens]
MDQNHTLQHNDSDLLSAKDASAYRRLVGRLIYLTVTRPDLSYPVQVLSQFLAHPRHDHLNVACKIVRYLKGTVGQDNMTDVAETKNENHLEVTAGTQVEAQPVILVYSLRTNSWRYCGDLHKAYHLEFNKCYIYVKECCYWLGSLDYSSELIISFNMANDSFIEIDVPDYAQPSDKCLAVYDDSLAFLSLHQTNKYFDIWAWSEGCWTKKFNVGPFPGVWSPIGHWMGNRLLLQLNDGKLVLFYPDAEETKDLAFQNNMLCRGVFAYMESLVSIKDKYEAGQQPEEN